jgi:predicted CXXCH cytochrome family protein
MDVEFTFLTQRGTAMMRRSQRASAERIRLGRGTDNEVALPDIRVPLRLAALGPAPDGMVIEKLGAAAPLLVNGQPVESAVLRVGDQMRLGPYRVEVVAPPEGCDGAIQIELVELLGADPVARAHIGLAQTHLNKRLTAWACVLLVALLFLAAPIVAFTSGALTPWHKQSPGLTAPTLVGLAWNSGEFSDSHRFFGANCATCHQAPFSRVADTACLSCHTNVGGHIEPGIKVGSPGERIAASRCIDCHSEHRGQAGVVFRSASLCLDCHRDLDKTAPDAGVAAVSGYPDGHPQFRATLVADAAQKQHARVALSSTPAPADHPGIKFSHAAHLLPGGFPKLGYKEMRCADCHVAEPDGKGWQAVTYNGQCQGCHNLKFDDVALPWADAKVPHGDDGAVIAAVWNFYAAKSVKDGISAPPAAAPPTVERRGAGMPVSPASTPPPSDVPGWIAAKSATAIGIVFDKNRGCTYCHYGTGADGTIDAQKIVAAMNSPTPAPLKVIAPVELRTKFLPNAVFDHSRHRGMKCADCHTAVAQSQTSAEVLVPGIDTCKTCHGSEKAHLAVQSTCITCHAFHRHDFGPMHPTEAAAK